MATSPKEHPAVTAVRQSGANKVKVAVSDIDGILRGKYLHKDKFFGAAEPHPKGGFGFCDVVMGWDMHGSPATTTPQVTGWQHGFPDALARLDLNTARHVPWDDECAVFPGRVCQCRWHTPPAVPAPNASSACFKRAEKMGSAGHDGHGVRVVQLR